MTIRSNLVCVMVAAITVGCFGQGIQEHKGGSVQLLGDLRSGDPATRYRAFQQVRSNAGMLRDADVQSRLLDLLDQENREFDMRVRKAQQPELKDEDRRPSDGNPQYMDALLTTVEAFADLHNSRQICLLVKAGYMPASPNASENALRAQAAMSCLQQLSKSDLALDRLKAAKIFVELLASARDRLDQDTTEAIRQAVMLALHDKDDSVRSQAVDTLESHGGTDLIPALREVAESDPAVSGATHEFWIRKEAAKAIAAIQQRESHE